MSTGAHGTFSTRKLKIPLGLALAAVPKKWPASSFKQKKKKTGVRAFRANNKNPNGIPRMWVAMVDRITAGSVEETLFVSSRGQRRFSLN